MTDVLAPVLIPYARFLEVRARRLDIVTELAQPNGDCPTNVTVSSKPVADTEALAIRPLELGLSAGASPTGGSSEP
jgi:hypothetical protein